MTTAATESMIKLYEERHELEDYQGGVPRWCTGCGDNAILAAAAPDNNHKRAGNNGLRWFKSLGARNVDVTFVIDKSSAQDEALALSLRSAKLIYLLGGFPHYLGETLLNSLAWQAILDAYHSGAVIAGSSAGAMVLCENYYDPYESKLLPGLNLIPNSCVLPHHNTMGKNWAAQLSERLPKADLIGIDEQTGMINNNGEWTVYGAGAVTLYRQTGAEQSVYTAGKSFLL